MQKYQRLSIALITVAILSGCATPKENPALTNAHSSYDSARSNPQVTNLAALELKEASDSLARADAALSKGEEADTVSHLAYLASQKVRIAEEAANRKAAELAVANAAAERDRVRLEARTAEVGAARQEAGAAREEAETAKQDAAAMKETADQQAERDQALIAQQERQLEELKAKKTERGLVITLGDVLFRTNRAQLNPAVIRDIQKLADFLNEYPQRNVLIEGHTDSTGSSDRNQELSEQRADAVRTALVDMGISTDRITTRGYGESYPVATNATASGRRSNRRVEIIVSDNDGNITPRSD